MSSPREAELGRQLQAREEELRQANVQIALLKQRIDILVRRIFGSKSEKVDSKQLELLLQLQQQVQELGKAEASLAAEAIPCSGGHPLQRRPSLARTNHAGVTANKRAGQVICR